MDGGKLTNERMGFEPGLFVNLDGHGQAVVSGHVEHIIGDETQTFVQFTLLDLKGSRVQKPLTSLNETYARPLTGHKVLEPALGILAGTRPSPTSQLQLQDSRARLIDFDLWLQSLNPEKHAAVLMEIHAGRTGSDLVYGQLPPGIQKHRDRAEQYLSALLAASCGIEHSAALEHIRSLRAYSEEQPSEEQPNAKNKSISAPQRANADAPSLWPSGFDPNGRAVMPMDVSAAQTGQKKPDQPLRVDDQRNQSPGQGFQGMFFEAPPPKARRSAARTPRESFGPRGCSLAHKDHSPADTGGRIFSAGHSCQAATTTKSNITAEPDTVESRARAPAWRLGPGYARRPSMGDRRLHLPSQEWYFCHRRL